MSWLFNKSHSSCSFHMEIMTSSATSFVFQHQCLCFIYGVGFIHLRSKIIEDKMVFPLLCPWECFSVHYIGSKVYRSITKQDSLCMTIFYEQPAYRHLTLQWASRYRKWFQFSTGFILHVLQPKFGVSSIKWAYPLVKVCN